MTLGLLAILACSSPSTETTTGESGLPTTVTTTATSPSIRLSDVEWSLHPEFESIVEVTWTQDSSAIVWVEFSVDDGVWLSSPPAYGKAGVGSTYLLGVPYETNVSFVVRWEMDSGISSTEPLVATTGVLPNSAAIPNVLVSSPELSAPELNYFLFSDSNAFTAILDRQARVVWMRENDWSGGSLMPRISVDGGDILIESNSYWWQWDQGAASYVERMNIDGSDVSRIDTPGLHHPYVDLPDGSIVYGAVTSTSEELVHADADGALTLIFECKTFSNMVGSPYCGTNTTWYDSSTDSVFWSLYSHDSILEIDRKSGELLRHFGTKSGAWSFDPPESAFWWQHGVNVLENGNLITSTHTVEQTDECIVREYAMDYANQTLVEVWNFGVGAGVNSDAMGEAHRLSNGNTLHNNGAGDRMMEVTADGTIVWDLAWNFGNQRDLGRTTPIEDLYSLAP